MFEELDICKGMVAASGVRVSLKCVLSLGEGSAAYCMAV